MRKEVMSNEGLSLVGDLMAARKPLSTTEFRRKGVRKTNSGGLEKNLGKQEGYRPQRSKSDCSGAVSMANRQKVAGLLSENGNLDASLMSTITSPSSDEESVGSYSLSNDDNDDSIDSRPFDRVRSQVARINKNGTEYDISKRNGALLPRTSSERSSREMRRSSLSYDQKERDAVSPHSVGRRPPSPHSVGRRPPSPHSVGRRPPSPHSVGKRPSSPHGIGGKRPSSPHSVGGSRPSSPHDLLDNQKSRGVRKRSASRSKEQEIILGDLPLDNQKSRNLPNRTNSRSSEKSEVDLSSPVPPRKESPHAGGRKKPSRRSSIEGSGKGTSASPPSLTDSPHARGRKKQSSMRSVPDYSQKSSSSMSLTSTPMTARSKSKRSLKGDDTQVFTSPPVSVRSKSKKSLLKKENEDDGESSMRKERRKARARSKSKSRTGETKLRSSSRKRIDGKRQGRRSRTPSKDECFESELDTSERRKDEPVRQRRSRTPSKDECFESELDTSERTKGEPVTEEEIMQLLNSSKDPSLKGEEDESETKDKRAKRRSKSPGAFRPEALKKSNSDTVRRPRSGSSGNMEKRMTRRLSMDAQTNAQGVDQDKKEKRTRNPPRRAKSNNIGVDRSALDSFLKNSAPATDGRRRKTSSGSRSVKSHNVSASRSVATTRTAKTRRRRKGPMSNRSLKNLGSGTEHLDQLRDQDIDDISGHRSFDEEDLDVTSDEDTYDDNRSHELDLDLATARDNFARQNANEKLQMHLTKTDELLYSVFPKHVANALRNGQKVEPENHDLVTIFFSDIVGFTDISAKLDPLKISDMLDRLYNSFDALSDYHDVFKVETIGDAYMAVTNLTKSQPDHCKRITEFAIDAIRVANQTMVDESNPGMGFVNIRVGFHSGSVVSNVVGTRNPRYCLFGDTVNTASRMESNSEKNRIHCSEVSAKLLREQCPRMRIFPRGAIEVKGKGEMKTFWIHREGSLATKKKNPSAFQNFIQNVRNK